MQSEDWLILIGAIWLAGLIVVFFGAWFGAAAIRRARRWRNRWGR